MPFVPCSGPDCPICREIHYIRRKTPLPAISGPGRTPDIPPVPPVEPNASHDQDSRGPLDPVCNRLEGKEL